MRWLTAWAAVVVAVLMWPTLAWGYTFGDWASDQGYDPNDVLPGLVYALGSSIDSLDGIDAFDWTTTPTTVLDLYDNQLSSIETDAFNGLTNLMVLYLGSNQISSLEAGDFNGLTNLTTLQLWENELSSIDADTFNGLTNLELLDLQSNQISSIESEDFGGLTNLTTLYLFDNLIASIEAGAFSGLTNLTTLQLWENELSSIDADTFNGLSNLELLFLQGNQISSIESEDFGGLTNLTTLYLFDNQIASIEAGAFSGLTNLTTLDLFNNSALTELNLTAADFSNLDSFSVNDNVNITRVSLNNTVLNQVSLDALLDGGTLPFRTGFGELSGITELDLSGVDFNSISDLAPLSVLDGLTDLWLVDTSNLDASALDVLLDNLDTIEGTGTEGILHMTQANFDALNTAGGGLLATWHSELGHHVEFVQSCDFNDDGICDGADFLLWQRDPSVGLLSDWEANYGMSVPMTATSAAVPEPATWIALLFGMMAMLCRREEVVL